MVKKEKSLFDHSETWLLHGDLITAGHMMLCCFGERRLTANGANSSHQSAEGTFRGQSSGCSEGLLCTLVLNIKKKEKGGEQGKKFHTDSMSANKLRFSF